MCSDSEKNMSAFADQNHAPSLTCVRLELDVASRQIDLLQKVRIHASMIYTFFVNLHGSEYRQYIALMVR